MFADVRDCETFLSIIQADSHMVRLDARMPSSTGNGSGDTKTNLQPVVLDRRRASVDKPSAGPATTTPTGNCTVIGTPGSLQDKASAGRCGNAADPGPPTAQRPEPIATTTIDGPPAFATVLPWLRGACQQLLDDEPNLDRALEILCREVWPKTELETELEQRSCHRY
ncbi:hypothetical protein ACQY0O_001375 [Thecaphora frezii]